MGGVLLRYMPIIAGTMGFDSVKVQGKLFQKSILLSPHN